MDNYHLSLSIGKALWDDLVSAALPIEVAQGPFNLGKSIYQGTKQLQVRRKVSALLEDHKSNESLQRIRKKISQTWGNHRSDIYKTLDQIFHVEGEWSVNIDDKGTDFHYADQKIGVDAHVKGTVSGSIHLLKNNLELPFKIEKRLGASCHLGDIQFDANKNSVVGTIQDPSVDLGDHFILQLLNEAAVKLLSVQVDKLDAVQLIQRQQLDEMLTPAGPLQMHIADVGIEVSPTELSLRVRFGFSQKQLTDET